MPTTRSASKNQTNLEKYAQNKSATSPASAKNSSQHGQSLKSHQSRHTPSSKRKRSTEQSERNPKKPKKTESSSNAKVAKESKLSTNDVTELEKPILINRSPVLQLWAATVAKFLHPNETWNTCLSIGGSISTLCAISKGRAIGKVEPKDSPIKAQEKPKRREQDANNDSKELGIMGFTLNLKEGVVVIDGKPKPVKEGLLQGKFGGEEAYSRVKAAMEDALRIWSDEKEELDKKAFHMYEKFRPNVASGSSGWGRKGELNLHQVQSTIEAHN